MKKKSILIWKTWINKPIKVQAFENAWAIHMGMHWSGSAMLIVDLFEETGWIFNEYSNFKNSKN